LLSQKEYFEGELESKKAIKESMAERNEELQKKLVE
jgi:hypothetical protein